MRLCAIETNDKGTEVASEQVESRIAVSIAIDPLEKQMH